MSDWYVCADCGKVLHEADLMSIYEPVIVGDTEVCKQEIWVCPHCRGDVFAIEEEEIELYEEMKRDD